MATSVFGTPITHETLMKMEQYSNKQISRYDMGLVAFETKNADGKDARAREFVEERRKAYVFDCTLCLIYNATGDVLKLETYCDAGDGFVAPSPYPMIISNGQWDAFLKRGGGAVVYTARNSRGYEHQVVYVFRALAPGRCYTEIRERNYYKPNDPWTTYQTPLNANQSHISEAHSNGLSSFASIGGSNLSPVFEGIVTVTGVWSRYPPRQPYYRSGRDQQSSYMLAERAQVEEASSETRQGDPNASMASEEEEDVQVCYDPQKGSA